MQVGSLYLFPLEKINSRLRGYYISVDGRVYSTKQVFSGRLMFGSGTFGSKTRYYTLNNASYEGVWLLNASRVHPDWESETSAPSRTEVTMSKILSSPKHPSGRSHAPTVKAGIQARGVVIARVAVHEGVEHLLFGSKPALHMTEQSYTDEMTRLATQYPGVEFVALKVVKSVKAGDLTWS